MSSRSKTLPESVAALAPAFVSGHSPANGRHSNNGNGTRQLRVMKFGGTSVADAASIERVIEIIRVAVQETNLVVVVSAMSGVTNKLIEAGTQSEAGNCAAVEAIFEELRVQHETAVGTLIHSPSERERLSAHVQTLFEEIRQLSVMVVILSLFIGGVIAVMDVTFQAVLVKWIPQLFAR